MSGAVKTIASIALPIAGSILLPGVGTALGLGAGGLGIGASGLAAIGGAVGGAAGGAISGGGVKGALKGAALGGVGGYLTGGGLNDLGVTGPGSLLGEAAGTPLAGGVGPTEGSGVLGTATRAIASTPSVSSILSSPSNLAYPIIAGNVASGVLSANASEDAAKKQLQATQQAIAAQQGIEKPYVDAGKTAIGNYESLANDPNAQLSYVKDNPFYQGLAQDAQRRLLASQATAGKIASGGTANELQTQLLNLGNGLVQQQLGNESSLINTGANAASGVGSNTANLITEGGNASAAGRVGTANAYNSSYQNMINSLLALQNLKGQQNLSGSLNNLSSRLSNLPTYNQQPVGI